MKNLQSIQRYIGTASETKPTGINPGSEFIEYDTKEKHITYDGTNWVRDDIGDYSYKQSIAEGLRTNHVAWEKFGFNPAVGASTEAVCGMSDGYTFPPTAANMEIISSDVNDTATGTGVRTVKVHYLNSSYEELTETVSTNGTTAVAMSAANVYRVNYFKVISTGSTTNAIGNIDVRASADTPVYSRILAGTTRARDLVFTVPKGKSLFVDQMSYSVVHTAANKFALMTLRTNYDRIDNVSSSVFYPESTIMLDNGAIPIVFDIPIKFPEGTDFYLTASSNGTAAVSISMRGWIEPV